ncbi:MAG: ABC transporter substrate-binding protein [Proteobacteria bacterium]|nr:ABC transporter substrate-binding protein [Pseudomonadota bacterium]
MLKKFLLGGILFVWTHGAIATVEREKAEAFMTEIGNRVITLLTNHSITQQEKAAQFQEILETKFNVKAIGKFVLGRYWKHASAEEKGKFLDLFMAATVACYATRFSEYTSEKFEVIGSRPEKDGGVTVLTRIVRPNGQPILIDWKIFEKKGELRIYDVILEGISMSITQRSEYSSVIQQGGGTIQALITALEKKAGRQRSR